MRTARFSGHLRGGGLPRESVCPGGVCPGRGYVCHTPLPLCGQTDAFENITLPQSSFEAGN